MLIEFLIKNKDGVFVPFNKNETPIIDSIFYCEDCDEKYENLIFADSSFLNSLPYIEFKINVNEEFNAIYLTPTEGIDDEEYLVLKSKHKNIGNIGFYSKNREFYILTKNIIENNKIKITYKPEQENILYLFVNKNKVTQNVNEIKNLISNLLITII